MKSPDEFIFFILFIIISICSFILSFVNLMDAAVKAGILPLLSPLWPLIIDCTIIMGSFFVFRSGVLEEPTYQGWIVLLSFTGISILFNVINSPPDIVSQSAHALPPLCLCVSLEILLLRVRRNLSYHITITGDLDIVEELQEKIDADKLEKVKNYFTEHPEASVNKARIDLRMNHTTVKNIRTQLITSGVLQEFSE